MLLCGIMKFTGSLDNDVLFYTFQHRFAAKLPNNFQQSCQYYQVLNKNVLKSEIIVNIIRLFLNTLSVLQSLVVNVKNDNLISLTVTVTRWMTCADSSITLFFFDMCFVGLWIIFLWLKTNITMIYSANFM